MNKDVEVLLKILKEKGFSIRAFSIITKIRESKITSWKLCRGNPKAEDSVLIQNFIANSSKINTLKDVEDLFLYGQNSENNKIIKIKRAYVEAFTTIR